MCLAFSSALGVRDVQFCKISLCIVLSVTLFILVSISVAGVFCIHSIYLLVKVRAFKPFFFFILPGKTCNSAY